jgi:hypothetical protein
MPTVEISSHEHEWEHGATARCAECGGHASDYSVITVEGRTVHEICARTCSWCDERVLAANSGFAVNGNGLLVRLCESCHDNHTWTCRDCDTLHTDDAWHDDAVCTSCESERAERAEREARFARVIGGYHNPERRAQTAPISSAWTRANGDRHFGVELECEMASDTFCDDERQDTARALLEVANADTRRMWAEHDGSLNWGFELITQPMGLDAHAELWPRVLTQTAARALRSHDTRTCGLHVHVSRRGLTTLQIARAVVFLNAPENEVLVRAIARRYGNSYCRIAKKALRNAADSHDRYEMLNLTNSRTVEFRLFRGTLRAETVLACVEFANAVLEFARTASNTALTTDAFLAHVYDAANAADTKHLRRFFARRVTERAAPRYEPLKSAIESLTKRALRAPRVTDNTARWAEV